MNGGFPQEVEIKLALAGSGDLDRLAESLGPAESDVLQDNTFYDTPDGALAAQGWALRLRREAPADGAGAERYFVTVKGPATCIGSAMQRNEVEREIDPLAARSLLDGKVTFSDLDGGPPIPALEGVRIFDLVRTARFVNRRRRYRLTLRDKEFQAELDETSFETPGGILTERELEMELPQDTPPTELVLTQMELEAHLTGLGIRYERQPAGKYSRALAHSGRKVIDP